MDSERVEWYECSDGVLRSEFDYDDDTLYVGYDQETKWLTIENADAYTVCSVRVAAAPDLSILRALMSVSAAGFAAGRMQGEQDMRYRLRSLLGSVLA